MNLFDLIEANHAQRIWRATEMTRHCVAKIVAERG
jgi:hypothetical protein